MFRELIPCEVGRPRLAFSDIRFDVIEYILELAFLAYYSLKYMFNNVPIPMRNVLESEFKTVTGCLQSRCVVGETDRGVDDIFLAESMDNIY